MQPYYQDKQATIYHGDCRELTFENISALVTDPPYELGFMGKEWDQKGVSFQIETWQHLRGLCLSGAPLLSFGGTRTFHRIACAIEDAGWEIRDTLMWVYGQGFPKSLDIGKAIDKQQGTYIEGALSPNTRQGIEGDKGNYDHSKRITLSNPQSPEAKVWEGYGTALKPAYEPIILGMNPLEGTFAQNALKHKVAGLNIDQCRIAYQSEQDKATAHWNALGMERLSKDYGDKLGSFDGGWKKHHPDLPRGRFPSNFIHDGSQMVLELFPESKNRGHFPEYVDKSHEEIYGKYGNISQQEVYLNDNGSAARFFYCAKASKAERERGLEAQEYEYRGNGFSASISDAKLPRGNNHPTVKPLGLMEYLVKLVKMPEYNLILDPFMGSGTTLLACIKLGIPCIGIDNDEHTCEIAARRCGNALPEADCLKNSAP